MIVIPLQVQFHCLFSTVNELIITTIHIPFVTFFVDFSKHSADCDGVNRGS